MFRKPALNQLGHARVDALDEIFENALRRVQDEIEPGRALALVKTKLEEAHAHAVAGVHEDSANLAPPILDSINSDR